MARGVLIPRILRLPTLEARILILEPRELREKVREYPRANPEVANPLRLPWDEQVRQPRLELLTHPGSDNTLPCKFVSLYRRALKNLDPLKMSKHFLD